MLLEAIVAGLPVLATDICGFAKYIVEADAGCVLPSPFKQANLNQLLADMLESDSRARCGRTALRSVGMPTYTAFPTGPPRS